MAKPTTEELVKLAQELRAAPHGEKSAIIARKAASLQTTPKTLHNWIKSIIETSRKPRNDKGSSDLSIEEARLIAALMRESARQTGKQLNSIGAAAEILRSNGKIKAERIDKATGELIPLSEAAISRALMSYGLHPKQLSRPAPAQTLRTPHPNFLWQIDASLCVLYYLPRNTGLSVMDQAVFYKNKPDNATRIENDRVWRYVVTDHTSGTLYVEYVYGGETGENLVNCFTNAMQYRGRLDPFHGVPHMVMLDPGSANTGSLFKSLCQSLGVRVQINAPGNPRAKGQVENANNLVERGFEHGLKLASVATLDELNELAWRWMRNFNAQIIHRRHGMTRYAAWAKITADQLVKAPNILTCRALAHERPETRVVSNLMQISWKGDQYDVGHIPNISNGDKIEVARNPWRDNSLRVIGCDADGQQMFYEADMIKRDAYGFAIDAPVIGETFKSHTDTPTVQAQKVLEKLAMNANTQAEAEGKRKAKTIPFGGTIDPYKPLTDTELPNWMEKRGTESPVQAPDIRLRPLSPVEAAKQLRGRLGDKWKPEYFARLKAECPTDQVTQEKLDELERSLLDDANRALTRPALRVVGGG